MFDNSQIGKQSFNLRKNFVSVFLSILAFFLLFCGCQHFAEGFDERRESEKQTVKIVSFKKDLPLSIAVSRPLIPEDLLKARIKYLNDRIDRKYEERTEKGMSGNEMNLLLRQIKMYLNVQTTQREMMRANTTREREILERKIFEKLWVDLEYLQNELFAETERADRNKRKKLLFGKIEEAYNRGDYAKTIELYRNCARNCSEEEIPVNIQLVHSISLSRTGKIFEATEDLKKVIAKEEREGLNQTVLYYYLANWFFLTGNYESARQIVDGMVNDYDDKGKLLDRVIGPLEDIASSSEETEFVRLNNKEMEAVQEMEKLCSQIINDHPGTFSAGRALSLLNTMDSKNGSASTEEMVTPEEEIEETELTEEENEIYSEAQEALPAVEKKEDTDNFSQEEAEKSLKEEEDRQKLIALNYERANLFFENGEYEKAIVEFGPLTDSEYGEDCRKKITFAINELANKKRIEASKLFLKAKGIKNPEEKKGLLIDTYILLREAIDKYPQNKYEEKLKRNIGVVEEEIEKVNTQLLNEEKYRW